MRRRNVNTSPPAPQPKQWKKARSSLTLKDGVFSSWKGHRPTWLRPVLRNETWIEISSTMLTRERISDRTVSEYLTGMARRGPSAAETTEGLSTR